MLIYVFVIKKDLQEMIANNTRHLSEFSISSAKFEVNDFQIIEEDLNLICKILLL